MERGTSVTYKRIEARVDQTLRDAAEMLKNIEKSCEEEQPVRQNPKTNRIERKSVTVTSCSTSSMTSGHQQPKATIRTPIDACKKNRQLYFPKATITSNPTYPKSSTIIMSSEIDTSSCGQVTTPDSLFPCATYIPAKQGSKIQISPFPRSTESTNSSVVSTYRKHIEKLAVEPLEDIKQLKCRGQKKSKPDSMFPKASYNPGAGAAKLALSPSTGSSCGSLSSLGTSQEYSTRTPTTITTPATSDSASRYQPMEFISKDGRLRMLLQPLEETPAAVKVTKKPSVPKPKDMEIPLVPKQLESSHNLKFSRAKFSAKLNVGEANVHISGLFSGDQLKKKELTKLVINGQTFKL